MTFNPSWVRLEQSTILYTLYKDDLQSLVGSSVNSFGILWYIIYSLIQSLTRVYSKSFVAASGQPSSSSSNEAVIIGIRQFVNRQKPEPAPRRL